MKSIEFAYWLKGALEINDTGSFNEKQTNFIKSNLAQVKAHEENPSGGFSTFLKGFFEMSEVTQLTKEQATKIRTKLESSLEAKAQPIANTSLNDRPPGVRC